MRLPATLLSMLCIATVNAGPIVPKDEAKDSWNALKQLFGRQGTCAGTLCGYYNQLCCVNQEKCYTDLQTKAYCATIVPAETLGSNLVSKGAGEVWSYSTYTTTNARAVTVTTSYYVGAVPTTALVVSTANCANAAAQCGANCCDLSYQSCDPLTPGLCINIASTGTYGAPTRPISSGSPTTVAATTTRAPTATDTFAPALGTGTSTFTPVPQTKGLSPGAIAGIVIGVIAAVILLLLICFCCILKAGFDGILALLGLRNRRKTERTEVIEERYSRYGSGTGASRRNEHKGWFGGGGGSKTRVTEKRKSGLAKEGGILAAIAAGLAGLWLILGSRKKKDHRSNASNVSYETYTDSYTGTSASK